MIDWITGWYHTLAIKYRNRPLYDLLCAASDDPFDEMDYVEVPPPEV